jgi:hypothetical protein
LAGSNYLRTCISCVALLIFGGSCHETLPPRVDPKNVFLGTMDARYVLRTRENNVEACIEIRNIFDETLQSTPLLKGELRITLKSDTSYHATAILSPRLLTLANYDSVNNILTVDPGAPIHLRYVWDFIDDRGRDLRRDVFVYAGDPSCPYRQLAGEVTITLAGELQVFDHTGIIPLGPVDLTFRYITQLIDARICPFIQTDGPCAPVD